MNLAFIQGIGPLELTIVLVVVLLIFGPKRLPSLARSMGSGMREFKDSLTSKGDEDGQDTSPATRAALGHADEPKPAATTTTVAAEPVPERR